MYPISFYQDLHASCEARMIQAKPNGVKDLIDLIGLVRDGSPARDFHFEPGIIEQLNFAGQRPQMAPML